MRAHFAKPSAFTFIELLIVITILAILAVALSLSYQVIQLKVRFDANVAAITELFQRARTLSLSTVLINDTDATHYYELKVGDGQISLDAYNEDGSVTENIDSYDYDTDMNIVGLPLGIYYFPPYGEVCIGLSTCDSGATEATITFRDTTRKYTTEFTITTTGGYVDVVQVTP